VTAHQSDSEAGPERLYRDLLDAWNRRDAAGMAALFAHDGGLIGFDGSQIDGGPPAVAAHLTPIFTSHATPAYIAAVREVRALAPNVSLVRAVAGMVPDGRRELNPALNTIHTLTAVEAGGMWRAAIFQNTPAAFHGRPDLAQALTEELRALLPKPPPPAAGTGPELAMSGVGNTARWIAASRAKETELALPLFSDPYARELSGEAGFELLEAIRTNGRISLVFASPRNYRALHLKGRDAVVETADDARQRGLVAQRLQAFQQQLEPYGFPLGYSQALYALPEGALTAIRFTPEGAWSQTPGPGAGHALELQR